MSFRLPTLHPIKNKTKHWSITSSGITSLLDSSHWTACQDTRHSLISCAVQLHGELRSCYSSGLADVNSPLWPHSFPAPDVPWWRCPACHRRQYLTVQSQPRGSSLACVPAIFQDAAEQESTKEDSYTALWSQRKSRNRISTGSPLGVHTCPPALCEKPMLCASHLGQHHPHSCSDICERLNIFHKSQNQKRSQWNSGDK